MIHPPAKEVDPLVSSVVRSARWSWAPITPGAALHLARWPVAQALVLVVITGMGLPPVVVGLAVTLLLWRTGSLGLSAPAVRAASHGAGAVDRRAADGGRFFTYAALGLQDPDLAPAMRADGAAERRVAFELVRAAGVPILVAIAAGLGRAIAEVGASLMVGGNIVGQGAF